jgi:Flp pilus assembly protein TadG
MPSRTRAKAFARLLRLFIRGESGMTLPMLGLTIMAIIGFVGTAVDIGRFQLVQSKLSYATDAAGLAAGATLNTTDYNAEVTKYLNANFPAGYLGASVPGVTVTLTNNNMVINLVSTTTVPTTLMQMFGISQLTVTATSQVTRTASGLELVMVLDNTGSMAGTKISNLKTAATTLVNILYGGQANVANLWIGLVPFSMAVNIGTAHTTWMDATYDNSLDWASANIPWAGCVEARETNGEDITDDPPAVAPFQAYYWPSTWYLKNDVKPCYQSLSNQKENNWYSNNACKSSGVTTSNAGNSNEWEYLSSATTSATDITPYKSPYYQSYSAGTKHYKSIGGSIYGPNGDCPQQVTPMTASQTTILNAINNMQPNGSTLIPLGLAWGWRMLSPRWQGLWGGEMNTNNLPLAYNTPHMNKAVILLTDGYNTMYDYYRGAYGYLFENRLGTTDNATAVTTLNNKMISVCNSLKNNGVYVYTIALDVSTDPIDSTTLGLLQSCASSQNYYFHSPSAAQLNTIFSAIADSLSNLRVSQ